MSTSDIKSFLYYLQACTDRQVIGVWDREYNAGRMETAEMARHEAIRRGLY